MNESSDALKGCSVVGSQVGLIALGAVAGAAVTAAIMLTVIYHDNERRQYLEGFHHAVVYATEHPDATYRIHSERIDEEAFAHGVQDGLGMHGRTSIRITNEWWDFFERRLPDIILDYVAQRERQRDGPGEAGMRDDGQRQRDRMD